MKISAHGQRSRLRQMAKRGGGAPARPRQCRICLTEATYDARTGQWSVDKGVCRDRADCESRQAPLW